MQCVEIDNPIGHYDLMFYMQWTALQTTGKYKLFVLIIPFPSLLNSCNASGILEDKSLIMEAEVVSEMLVYST
jgi:hypothetical protein